MKLKFLTLILISQWASAAGLLSASPVPLTTADYQAQTQQSIQMSLSGTLQLAAGGFQNIYNQVWNNPNLTPQQVFNAFGTNACQLVTIAQNFTSTMNTFQPGVLPTPTAIPSPNSDCTVTVVPYPSPSPSHS